MSLNSNKMPSQIHTAIITTTTITTLHVYINDKMPEEVISNNQKHKIGFIK